MRQVAWLSLLLLTLASTTVWASDVPAAPVPPAPADEEKILYAIGVMVGGNLTHLRLSESELKKLQEGMADQVLGRSKKVDPASIQQGIDGFSNYRMSLATAANKKAGAEFLAAKAKLPGVSAKPNGILIETVTEGTGPSPTANDKVTVHYVGSLIDGTVFDSSVARGEPATFALDRVIPCWTDGLQFLKVGGKSKLYCPSDAAYGDGGQRKIPPGATLVFDVELLGVNPASAKAPS